MLPKWKCPLPAGLLPLFFILNLFRAVSFAEESVPAPGQTPAAEAVLALDRLQHKMLAENPELQAAKAAFRAARAKAGAAGGLDAPQVGVDFFQAPAASFPDPLKDNPEIDYFAQQEMMFPGRLFAMGTMENRRADMLEQDARMLELRLIRNLKNAYYDLCETDRKLEINRQNLELMGQLQTIARKQYELGLGNQSDVLRAQTEYSLLQNTRLILSQARESAAAELNTMLNLPADAPVGTTVELEPAQRAWTLKPLADLAEKHLPELQAARLGLEMSRAGRGAAFWEFFPDVMARGMYKDMRGRGENFWSLMLGVTVPIAPWALPKTLAHYRQAGAEVEQAEANFRQTRNLALARVQQSLTRVLANQAISRLHRTTLLPQAEQTLQSTLAAYRTGKRDFMALLDACRTLWTARENYIMAVKNLMTSLADLEQAVGLSLPEMETALRSEANK